MKKLSLTQIKENRKGRVLEISTSPRLQNKLLSMGIYPGREVVKLSQFALKGPVAIRAGRSILALGHSVASKIIVEVE